MQIIGVILAGGQGRRMGGADKALVPLGGQPLIAHVLARLRPQVDGVLISANGDATRLAPFGCEVVADTSRQGPLSGVLAALTRAADLGASHVVSVPVDTPFLPLDLVRDLRRAAGASPTGLAIAATGDGDHPATALWPVALAPALAAYLAAGGARISTFTDAQGAARCRFADAAAFANLNTPEDLAAAEARIRGAA